MKKQAFTLVELIVIITILAILATIGFISFSGYLAGTRDINRVSQLKSVSDALELYRTRKDLPIPDDKVDIKIVDRTIGYQGNLGANVLETIEYTEKGLDPKDKQYFEYYLTKDKKYYQLLSFLEEENEDVSAWFFKGTQAIDYSDRIPKVTGRKLGILLDEFNTPISQVPAVTASGYLDIGDLGDTFYKAVIDDEETIAGTGYTVLSSAPDASCRRIKQVQGFREDGFYTVDPYGDGIGYTAYCAFDFKYTTFDSFIEDGDMENEKSLNWEGYTKTNSAKYSGDYSLEFSGYVGKSESSHFTYVNPDKKYRLEGYFKSGGSTDSKLYFGFVEYDESFNIIRNRDTNVVIGSEATLSGSVSAGDKVVTFTDSGDTCTTWENNSRFSTYGSIAFNIDDSGEYNDLPNYDRSQNTGGFKSMVDNGDTCTVTLNDTGHNIINDYPSGTKIRMHGAGGVYNYIAASGEFVPNAAEDDNVPSTWTKYSGEVRGISKYGADKNYFKRGTKFIKILFLANYSQSSNEILYADDLKLVEY